MKTKDPLEAILKTSKLHLRSLLVLLLSVFSWTVAYAQITPSADAYTDTATPTKNYGAVTLLSVDGATDTTYIRFDLASIPSGASVSQATLKLYAYAVNTAGSFNVDYVNGSWTESTITSSLAPALGTTIAASVPITTADKNQYILIDVTPAVQAWLSGSKANDGIALVANGTFNASFDSKENTATSHPPELDIVFAGGGTLTGVTTASGSGLVGGGISGTLNLGLLTTCASGQVLEWNGSAWACATAKGTGTITGVTAGTGLTGGGTSGGITLKVNPSTVPLLNTANTFVGNQAITGNLTDTGNITATGAIAGKTGTFSANSSNTVETITQSGAGVGLVVNAGGATYGTQSTAALLGVYAKATAAGGDGVSGNSTRGVGVYGYDNATSGTSVGVTGQSTSSGGYGVVGTSPNDGVYGDVAGPSTTGGNSILFYAGVWGDTGGCGGCDYYGVTGTADNNIAGLFVNTSNDFTTLYIQNNGSGGKGTVLETHGNAGTCTIDTGGSVGCTGKVGADASVDGGARKVSLYAVQSPENWFEDFGSGTLAGGAVTIALDATFAQTINTITGYHVFLTPNGDCKGLYISQKSAASFEVRELGGGSSSVAFDYRIVARRSGYENVRLTDVTEKYQRMEKQEQQRQQRMAQRRAARAAAGPIAAAVVAPHK
jgi:hypothetical protein